MKSITLHIPDAIYSELRSAMTIRRMSGSAYGILDSFIVRLIELIDAGVTEHTFAARK